ncbi:non-ribosomal peptide synthetase [Legionella lansingensis]|uniref:Non-ribosomal peptide synthetase n=1 Tax=Legionella lansingensis TaxID=45067 RepID=A0A0W0VV94_9GAMM|nr:amino acid adenylation domain-containing protein [Legionella lansingensis]KTD23817.1 non-ribosomal peptide synthetase [Legionella lansingensis]SNV46873.1 non-ribosomal peptide synthetase [Legionella lansingensis]
MENSATLHELFEIQAKQRPQHTAVIFGSLSLTYDQLNQKANQLAHYLREMGVKPDTTVALCMERSIELLIVILGILKAGGAYIPLDPSYPEERLLFILKEGVTPILITTSKWQEKLCCYEGQLLLFDEKKKLEKQKTHNLDPTVTPRHLAYVIYTSGSTGTPKGVMVEHRGIVNYSLWFANYCDCQAQQRIDFSSNPAFDFAVTTSIVPLVLGLTVIICEDKIKKDPRQYLKYLVRSKVNFIKLTPSYFKVLLYEAENGSVELPHLEKIMLAGESLSTVDCASWLAIYPSHILFNEYGPTETSVAVCLYRIDSRNISRLGANVPVGNLIPNSQSYILDANGIPVADGEVGELYLGGSCLARGYLNNPELTQQSFIKDPFSKDKDARLYKTGDLCRRLAKGEIEYVGRIDHQLKIRGYRVEPGEVEGRLAAHPDLKAAAVLAFEQKNKEKRLVAYYVLKEQNSAVSVGELRQYLKRYLPDYMVPTTFVRMESFPLNANEKLDRLALPAPQFTASQHYLPPNTSLEKMLAHVWLEELEIKPIGLNDDFFELGGHSLSAARMISKINYTLNKEVTLHDFYQTPTIAYLVTLIKKAKTIKKRQKSLTKALSEVTQLPLNDFQFLLWLTDTFEPRARKLTIFTRKRLKGHLNLAALTSAFAAVLKKHEALSYHVSKFRPVQYFKKHRSVEIIEENLQSLSEEKSEWVVENSLRELRTYHSWPKDEPQVIIRLFYLKNEVTELQLCLPHIISDDVSPEILLSDLSQFYLSASDIKVEKDIAYRQYIFDEQSHIQNHLNRDMAFWGEYLKDASLFAFPPEYIVKNMRELQLTYSTYTEIPEEDLNNFKRFCAHHHISILDGLCAVLLLALLHCCHESQTAFPFICINRVKSTREKQEYDKTIGCFLRLEPIKLALNKEATLAELCQQVHDSVIDTGPYQGCPNLVKLASIATFRQKKKMIKTYLVKWLTWLYTTVFRLKLSPKVLSLSGRLNSNKGNNFLININVQNSLLRNTKCRDKSTLFGFETENTRHDEYDLLQIDHLFDVCFLRMPDSDSPFLILSANLEPTFRERIAKEMLCIMSRGYVIPA